MSNEVQKTVITAEVWKNALKKTVKILFVVIMLVFYINAMVLTLLPRFSAKVYRFMGFSRAEEYSLERVYEKSKDNADLYNLIVFEQNKKNYEKELNYINMLMINDEYNEFCEQLDLSAMKTIKDKSLIAYMCNTKNYINSQKVKCLFNLGIPVETFIYSNLATDYLTENSYATYIEIVYNSNMSWSQKKEKIEALNETFSSQNPDVIVEDLFKERIADIVLEKTREKGLSEKILLEYSLMENYKAGYLYNLIIENETQAEVYKQFYIGSAELYYELVK